MRERVPLAPEVEARLRELGQVDLFVGIPSFNNARTIGHVVQAAVAGLAKYFPEKRSVIVNSDGGSGRRRWWRRRSSRPPRPSLSPTA